MQGSAEQSYYSDLYRLAHAHKLLRVYREHTGQTFETASEVVQWWTKSELDEALECDAHDLQVVEASRSVVFLEELYQLAQQQVPEVFDIKEVQS